MSVEAGKIRLAKVERVLQYYYRPRKGDGNAHWADVPSVFSETMFEWQNDPVMTEAMK